MPPRAITIAVVLFWLATTSFFLHRELRHLLISGEAPPFAIDLVDEASERPNHWEVFRNGKRVGKAETGIRYLRDDDQFELHSRFDLNDLVVNLAALKVKNIYRVTRDGELRGILTKMWILPPLAGVALNSDDPDDATAIVVGQVAGPVRDGRIEPTGWVALFGERTELGFDPVPLTGRGSVLNPLHPVHRLHDLRPGREWNVPLLDPMVALSGVRFEGKGKQDPIFAILASVLRDRGGAKFRSLNAHVLLETETITWGRSEMTCRVIEYKDRDEVTARTWVRERDGLVVQQEAGFEDARMTLKRSLPLIP